MKNGDAALVATEPARLPAPLHHVESFIFTPQIPPVTRLSLAAHHLLTRRLTSLVRQRLHPWCADVCRACEPPKTKDETAFVALFDTAAGVTADWCVCGSTGDHSSVCVCVCSCVRACVWVHQWHLKTSCLHYTCIKTNPKTTGLIIDSSLINQIADQLHCSKTVINHWFISVFLACYLNILVLSPTLQIFFFVSDVVVCY